MSDESDWTASRRASTRSDTFRAAGQSEPGQHLEDGFPWHRIRRLSKKG